MYARKRSQIEQSLAALRPVNPYYTHRVASGGGE